MLSPPASKPPNIEIEISNNSQVLQLDITVGFGINRSSTSEVLLGKGVMKLCSKFVGENLC